VRVLVKTRVSGAYAKSGDWFLFHEGKDVRQRGTVIPNHAGMLLVFEAQVLRSGNWRDLARASFRIHSDGTVTAYLRPKIGRYRVRNVFKGDADHLGNTSAWVLVRVTR
jgi:hypothetical protein